MSTKVKALYDFNGEPGSVELSIKAGELLTLVRDVGSGWYEGENAKGQIGLFPENYVEKVCDVSAGPSSIPAPQLPTSSYYEELPGDNPWEEQEETNGQATVPQPTQNQQDDFWDDDWDDGSWDDDWDDDSETGQQPPTPSTQTPVEFQQPAHNRNRGDNVNSCISRLCRYCNVS